MKVKDLGDRNLLGTKVKIPKKFEDEYQKISGEMYLYSWWNQGVWLKRNMNDQRMYPLCINPKEILNFTVIKEN